MDSVLVTGGAGYIGSHTAKVLARSGYRPVVLDDFRNGHRWAVQWGPCVEAELSDREAVRRALREHDVRAVVHFAASAYVGESMTNPRAYFHNNVRGTLDLLDEVLDAGIEHFVFSSTCATYGEPTAVPISEAHPQAPVNPYGESKLFVEKMLRWYEQAYDFGWVALRYFNAAGCDPDGETGELHDPETHLIPLTIDAALGRRPELGIFGTDFPTPDGTAIRDYIHVMDLAEAHVRALGHLRKGGSSVAVNLGTGRGYSVREVIAEVERVTGKAVPARECPRRAGDPPELVADARLAAKTFGWTPQVSELSTIVETAVRWQRDLLPQRRAE